MKGSLFTLQLVRSLAPTWSSQHPPPPLPAIPRPAPSPMSLPWASHSSEGSAPTPPKTGPPTSHPEGKRRQIRGWGIRSWVGDLPPGAPSYPGWGWGLRGSAQWAPCPAQAPPKGPKRAGPGGPAVASSGRSGPLPVGRAENVLPHQPPAPALGGGHPCGKTPHLILLFPLRHAL